MPKCTRTSCRGRGRKGCLRASRRRGGTLREDLDDNATLYGKKLANSEIVTKGVRPPKAAAKLRELLNRYSANERKN